jgi:hypothetical protein
MMMRYLRALGTSLLLARAAAAQSSISACGPLPDSTSRQQVSTFGALKVCLIATNVANTDAETPAGWAAKGNIVVLETQRPADYRRAAIVGTNVEWTINGQPAPKDSLADRWQKSVIELLDAAFEADGIRRQVAALRMQVDSLPARRAAIAQKIKDIERVETALDQQMIAVQSEERRRRIDIDRLEQRRDDYLRRASAEERKASATRDERARATYTANARQYYAEAQRMTEEIRRTESNGRDSNAQRRQVELEQELRSLTSDGNLALLRMQQENYDSTKVEDLEAMITQLDAPRRLPVLDARVEKARLELLAILGAPGIAPSR